jgi:integrase/recombinase XerD
VARDRLRLAVAAYLARFKGSRAGGPILLNTRGSRMDRHAATRRLHHLAETAGIQIARAHPAHAPSHLCHDHAPGADLRDVQTAARHADPRTTMRYANSGELHQMGEKPQVAC